MNHDTMCGEDRFEPSDVKITQSKFYSPRTFWGEKRFGLGMKLEHGMKSPLAMDAAAMALYVEELSNV